MISVSRSWVATCPSRCAGLSGKPTPACCTRCGRRRCCRSNRPITPNTASWCRRCSPRERLRRCVNGSNRPPTALLDQLEGDADVVDIMDRYCSQLPVTVIGDILGVPDEDRPRILHFGEMGAPSLDIGLSWPQFQQVQQGLVGFNNWLADHLEQLRRNPGDDLMSQIIKASDERSAPQPRRTAGTRRAGAGCRVRNHSQPAGQRNSDAARRTRASGEPGRPPGVMAECGRGDPAAGVAGADECAHRVQGRRRGRHPRAAATSWSSCTWRAPTVIPRYSPIRIASTSNATTRVSICPSPVAGTSASARRWPGPRGRSGLRTFFERFPEARLAGSGSRRDTRVLRGWSSLPVRLECVARSTVRDVDFRAALIEETAAFGELIRIADPAAPSRHVRTGRSDSCSATSAGETDGQRRSSPTSVTNRSTPGKCARASHRTIPTRPSTGSTRAPNSSSTPWTPLALTLRCGRSSDPGRRSGGSAAGVHESTVHRADAAIAVGADYQLSASLAADGINEWLERIAAESSAESSPLDVGQTLHLHATDDGLGTAGEWTITGTRCRHHVVTRTRQGRRRTARTREGSAAGRRPPPHGRRSGHRGFR